MDLISTDNLWFYTDSIGTLFKYIDLEKNTNREQYLYESILSYENHPSHIDIDDQASYTSHIVSIALDAAKNIDIRDENRIKSLQKHGFIYLNRNGGYNSIQGFIDLDDMHPSNKFNPIDVPKIDGPILFLENSKEIENLDKFKSILKFDNYSSITMLKENMERGTIIPAIKNMIEQYGKITICFSTTQKELSNEQIKLFTSFKDYIKNIFYIGSEKIGKQLIALDIETKEL